MSKAAMKLALEALERMTQPVKTNDETQKYKAVTKAITALREALAQERSSDEQPAQQEPYEIDWPDYHEQAMGCGLEDRGEHCRYGAMRYGWDCAIEAVAQALPDAIYTSPPAQRTWEEWFKWWRTSKVADSTEAEIDFADFMLIVRAVEAAHGIKENT